MPTDTFCTLWQVTPKVGPSIFVCNFESDLEYDGDNYTAIPLEPTEIQMASGLSPDNAEITIPLIEPFSSVKLLGGYWRGARVVMRVVDYSDMSLVSAHVGYLGEVALNNLVATPQYRSLAQILNQPIGDLYSETCRVRRFGDTECKAPIEDYTHTATVTAVDLNNPNQQFTILGTFADNILHKGWVVFTSGENDGLEEEVWSNDGGDVTLFKPMAGDVEVGDTVTVVEGCDRTRARCSQIVNPDNPSGTNIENMRAEPHLPGRTRAFTFPS